MKEKTSKKTSIMPIFLRKFRFLRNMGIAMSAALLPLFSSSSFAQERESFFQDGNKGLIASHFTWGAEVGTSIDVSGYDMSTFNIDALLGYKNDYFRILGIGAGIHRALGTGDNFVPVYAVMRTSFSSRPKLFFMSVKAGYSFNTISDADTFGDVSAALGAGINLALSRKFKSHIVLAYEFRHFNQKHRDMYSLEAKNVSLATLTFGVNF